ncbi:MAG: hypothetical protein L6Q54_11680 [Leptospiraceae bacterium]|nr:hypothetical protein [Leptospiraceae bacterium]
MSILGTEGRTWFGDVNGEISPANAYFKTEVLANLAGTVAVAGTAVTGTGTSFTTSFSVGQYVMFNDLTPKISKITAIASNTSMTIEDSLTVPALTTYRLYEEFWLGQTMGGITAKVSIKKSDIKHDQQGDSRADAVVTGYEGTVEIPMSEATAYRMSKVFQGFKAHLNLTGGIVGSTQGVPIGERDTTIARQLTLYKIVGGLDSTDPDDKVDFFVCAPSAEMEAKYDAAGQRTVKVTFNLYRDTTKKVDGVPLLWGSGTYTLDP